MQPDQKPEQASESNNAQENGNKDFAYPTWLPRGLFDALGPLALLVVVVGSIAAFYAYHYVTRDSVRFSFWIGFMFSFMALLVVTIQVVIYAQQREVMKQQWEAMVDSVRRTDTIIENMITTRELENRPWVGIKELFLAESPIGGFDIVAIYTNGGNSPALCSVEVYGGVMEKPPPEDFKYRDMPAGGSIMAFFPHGEYRSQIGHIVGVPPVNFPTPGHAYYLLGDIRYMDTFRRLHTTKFCYFMVGDIGETKEGTKSIHLNFVLAPYHNSFD